MDISIIGTGNVAYHMARAFVDSKTHRIVSICGRSIAKAKATYDGVDVMHVNDPKKLPKSDLILIAIADDSITAVSRSLAYQEYLPNTIIAHTSGSVSSEVLKDHVRHGVLYPLQTFSKGQMMLYSNIPFCICGSEEATTLQLQEIASAVSEDVRLVSDEQRAEIHLSAVMVNNLVNHLVYLSEKRLENLGLDDNILTPLIQQTVAKLSKQSSFNAQTGPARRADLETIKKHLARLEKGSTLQNVYRVLSESIIKTYHHEDHRRDSP